MVMITLRLLATALEACGNVKSAAKKRLENLQIFINRQLNVSEMLYWVILPFDATKASVVSVWFHDSTCPNKSHKDESFT